jgi:transposase InsO family protein
LARFRSLELCWCTEHIVIELTGLDKNDAVAAVPFVSPETLWVDRSRVFVSELFRDVCTRLGINLQLARPYTPTLIISMDC